jgi:hypothetical protein
MNHSLSPPGVEKKILLFPCNPSNISNIKDQGLSSYAETTLKRKKEV